MAKTCAVCGRSVTEKYKPFCSARCADVDLGRWLGETYKVPTSEVPDEFEELPDNLNESANGGLIKH